MRYKVLLLVFTVVCASCAQRADINYRIVTGQPLQVMEHFGASDAWVCMFWENGPKRNKNR